MAYRRAQSRLRVRIHLAPAGSPLKPRQYPLAAAFILGWARPRDVTEREAEQQEQQPFGVRLQFIELSKQIQEQLNAFVV